MSVDFEALTSAYHDGELRGWRRWRFEWRLRRDPALQRELAELAAVAEALREAERVEAQPHASLDVWPSLARRLAESEAEAAGGSRAGSTWVERLRASHPGRAALALAAASVAAVALVWLNLTSESVPPVRKAASLASTNTDGTVRSLDTGGRGVIVSEEEDVTIIWLVDGPPSEL
jgi:anti-sigma factor RsiW